jgi:DNA-binding MarR family transcriptional regulator
VTRTDSRDARSSLTEELLDELTAWTPTDRFRMLGAWHQRGLSLVQLNVVTLLEMHGPMPMGRVAELLGVSVASTTGIVDRMADRGLVERRGSLTDRRVVEVHIGERAHEMFAASTARRRDRLRQVLARVDDARMAGLLEGLRAVRSARAELERECADDPGPVVVLRHQRARGALV